MQKVGESDYMYCMYEKIDTSPKWFCIVQEKIIDVDEIDLEDANKMVIRDTELHVFYPKPEEFYKTTYDNTVRLFDKKAKEFWEAHRR